MATKYIWFKKDPDSPHAEKVQLFGEYETEFKVVYNGKIYVFPNSLLNVHFFKNPYNAFDITKSKYVDTPSYNEQKEDFPEMGLASWIKQHGYIYR